ncbi:MAG: squalene--hopene cyclase, partial [Planctomycetia bacterium]
MLRASFALWTAVASAAVAAEPAPAVLAPPGPISPDEPLAKTFSVVKAAGSLDRASFDWQTKRNCGACHTNLAILPVRPILERLAPSPAVAVSPRRYFEEMVEKRWVKKGPRWDAEVVAVAAALAQHDRASTGVLHPTTRIALDKIWTVQHEDGGFDWLKCGWPPMESDDHYGATLAAVAVGVAPGDYKNTPAARKGLDGLRRWLKANPAPSLHHKAMVLWASTVVDGLATPAERDATVAALRDLQRPDGGWAVASLLEGWSDHVRKDSLEQSTAVGDGYGTGFVMVVLRQAGVPAADPQLAKGVTWLKTHQRESGRWFTPSPTLTGNNFLANAGGAFAVQALDMCGA